MEIASGWIDEPGGLGGGEVGEEGCGATVAGCNKLIGKIVADLAVGGFGVAILDSIGVGAGLIHRVVVHLGT